MVLAFSLSPVEFPPCLEIGVSWVYIPAMDLLWMVRTKLAVNLRDLKAMMVTGFADSHLHMCLCGKVLPM